MRACSGTACSSPFSSASSPAFILPGKWRGSILSTLCAEVRCDSSPAQARMAPQARQRAADRRDLLLVSRFLRRRDVRDLGDHALQKAAEFRLAQCARAERGHPIFARYATE